MDMQVISILIITGIAIISPGPDFAMTLRNSLRHGRTSGLLTALGIACGISVHITYTVFGLSFLLLENAWILNSMKVIGACYLAWTGISSFFPKTEDQTAAVTKGKPGTLTSLTAFKTGFLSNALNPKTALFFIALFTQVISPGTVLSTQLFLGLFIALGHLLWFSIVALLLTHHRLEKIILKSKRTIEKVTGACLFALGVKIFFHSN